MKQAPRGRDSSIHSIARPMETRIIMDTKEFFESNMARQPIGLSEAHVERISKELGGQQPEEKDEVGRLLAERDRLLDQQRQIMQLLGTQSPEKVVHDLRNVLNELGLLRTLMESQE